MMFYIVLFAVWSVLLVAALLADARARNKLKAALAAKDAEISHANARRDLRSEELEKRSPEVLELALSARIRARQNEIERLSADEDKNAEAIEKLEQEKSSLEQDLARTRGFRLMLAREDEEDDAGERADDASDADDTEAKIDFVFFGEVGVDSGQLMVTDPCYIDSEWLPPSDGDQESLRDPSRGAATDGAPTAGENEEGLFAYSYRGVSEASLSNGYGGLAYRLGHAGAGVAFATPWGDGTYPVHGEYHNDTLVRVYITV